LKEQPVDLANLSIKRPIFVTCLVILSLAAGLLCMSNLGVDLFPDVNLPVVTVTIPYPGAGPLEIETLVTKQVEDELSTISGIKRISSESREGFGVIIAEFYLETSIQYDEQQVRDHYSLVKPLLPTDIKEATIQRIDPSSQPILQIALKADLDSAKLFDLADDKIKPLLEQANSVGKVEIIGGRKREIHVSLDRNKLKQHEISATAVSNQLAGAGQDIPTGKINRGKIETSFRTLGEFKSLDSIRTLVVNFFSNETPVRIGDLGTVEDTLQDENTRGYYNGTPTLLINAYKQSGSNTVQVAADLKKQINKINLLMKDQPSHPELSVVRDGADAIRINLDDVKESIGIGIVLAVIVVFLFLANFRSTIITGLALPNSLIGAFILMYVAGYTINIMSLLALTLSIGLLVDDAIVVRENIFRHLEMGKSAIRAALDGTKEVRLAVIATTLTVVSVFGPLGFLPGVVGQFMKQFGITIVFAMLISLFDALTIAPMLSAYFAGRSHTKKPSALYSYTLGPILNVFVKFQDWMEVRYERILRVVARHPFKALLISFAVFLVCMSSIPFIPKTFLPQQDSGEFSVKLDLPPGANLDGMSEVALAVDTIIRKNPEVAVSALTVGSLTGDANQADFYVNLVPSKQRKMNTSQFKAVLREQLKGFEKSNVVVSDYDPIGAGQRAFNLNILGPDQAELEKIALKVKDAIKNNANLLDVDVSFRPGKPEFQVRPDLEKTQKFGISVPAIGSELRTLVEGSTPARYRENGLEYDIRVRLQEDQRDLSSAYDQIYVPNINNSILKLALVSTPNKTSGPAKVTRQDRMRYVQVAADIRPGGGLGNVITDITNLMNTEEFKLPPGYVFKFVGQGEDFAELLHGMAFAVGAGILFIFLVLSSLYESFVTPFTIMLAIPLAVCGAFVALFVTHESIDIFSIIGLIMLLGVAVKNSILLVDYAHQKITAGETRENAIILAGKTRLRPILMTTMALIAGTLPIAMGLNEASKQRVSMGVAIIGGLISSTLLTLIVVPAAFTFIDRFRVWVRNFLGAIFIEGYDKSASNRALTPEKESPDDHLSAG
jgi:hydrophobic/amphiphilic exporter-1 (mainly G- bacteria), HAE1 family